MKRITIKDLPKNMKVTKEEMRNVMGGIGTWPTPEMPVADYYRAMRSKVYTRARPNYLFIDTVPPPE